MAEKWFCSEVKYLRQDGELVSSIVKGTAQTPVVVMMPDGFKPRPSEKGLTKAPPEKPLPAHAGKALETVKKSAQAQSAASKQ